MLPPPLHRTIIRRPVLGPPHPRPRGENRPHLPVLAPRPRAARDEARPLARFPLVLPLSRGGRGEPAGQLGCSPTFSPLETAHARRGDPPGAAPSGLPARGSSTGDPVSAGRPGPQTRPLHCRGEAHTAPGLRERRGVLPVVLPLPNGAAARTGAPACPARPLSLTANAIPRPAVGARTSPERRRSPSGVHPTPARCLLLEGGAPDSRSAGPSHKATERYLRVRRVPGDERSGAITDPRRDRAVQPGASLVHPAGGAPVWPRSERWSRFRSRAPGGGRPPFGAPMTPPSTFSTLPSPAFGPSRSDVAATGECEPDPLPVWRVFLGPPGVPRHFRDRRMPERQSVMARSRNTPRSRRGSTEQRA